ncbi:TonB-dependent siderophore receptor [Acinetobacter sp. NIPH 2699]|uniref:TonB-dependent siderophore receptor n=1 Tax=Acinetobacter sp. NIPH 2699 TaxID=2923433 RepID=UPI001F4BBC2A|nr:TonB-dependent siderophore receptor [Acinetobacter sp. NIPH 2699]MCH7335171.1 TonB-dependent siderophore receptor [Acinetobacter sp. NIPH 2699]
MKHHHLYTAIMLIFVGSPTTLVWAEIEDSDHSNILPTIYLKAGQDASAYTVKKSKSATKLDLSLKETPQSVTVFTAQQIEDQNLTSTNDVLAQTAGVTMVQYGQVGAGYNTYYSRGFAITSVQRDGMPTTTASFGGSDMFGIEDSAIYDRIEVTKGSTGLTSGSGNPSASINYVRKRPTADLQGSVNVQAGNWGKYRSQIDVSGGLNQDNSIRGRTVAVYEQGGSQQDRYHRQNAVIYGALDFDLTDKTTLTTALTAQQVKIDGATAHGFPFITHDGKEQVTFGRDDNPAANFTFSDTEKVSIFLGLEHQFNDNWQAIANYVFTKANNKREYGVAGSGGITYDQPYVSEWQGQIDFALEPGEMVVTSGRFESSPDVHSLDIYASGKFQALGHEHSASFGLNGYSIQSDDPAYGRYYVAVPIAGWNGNVARPDIKVTGRTIVDEQQLGAFVAAKLQLLDPLKLVVGGRLSNWERKVTKNEQKQNGVFTPYAGLIFDITEDLSAYTSYTTIFNPSSRKDVNGDYLDPEDGNSFEVGLKAAFYDGRLNASAAYFSMQQDNYAVADGKNLTPEGGQAYIGVDGAEVKGYELSIGGEILPNWNVQGGYTHTDAKDQTGNTLNSILPEDTFKLFTTYKWEQLTVGGGINWQSEIYDSASAKAGGLAAKLNRQESYYLVNLMGRYQVTNDMAFGVNVNNLFDKEYKANAVNTWGTARSVTASLNFKF